MCKCEMYPLYWQNSIDEGQDHASVPLVEITKSESSFQSTFTGTDTTIGVHCLRHMDREIDYHLDLDRYHFTR